MSAPRPAVSRILAAAEANPGRDFGEDLQASLGALVDEPAATRMDSVGELARAIPTVESPVAAGLLAVWFGASVEGGLDPGVSFVPVLETMLRFARRIETDDEGEPTVDPDEAVLAGMEFLGQALVAHLSVLDDVRRQAAEEDRILGELKRVEPFSVGAMWVVELLRRRTGELVVLNVAERAGVRVRYEEIGNCFHLFTLLQGAVAELWPAGTADPELLAVARGEADGPADDSAWWHYGQPFSNEANIAASVFGEGGIDSIGEVEGERVLLLWPPVLAGRSWDAGFFGPPIAASNPSVTMLGALTDEEVATWWSRLELPTA